MSSPLAKKISKLMDEHSINAHELERSAGLKKSAVTNILQGKSKSPSIDLINIISKKLGCSIDYLLTDMTEAPKDSKEKIANYSLCTSSVSILADYLTKSEILISPDDFFKCAQEIYSYTIDSKLSYIDARFVKWVTKKYSQQE